MSCVGPWNEEPVLWFKGEPVAEPGAVVRKVDSESLRRALERWRLGRQETQREGEQDG